MKKSPTPWVPRFGIAACLLIVGCASGDDSSVDSSRSAELEAVEAQLQAQLPNESELTRSIVADGAVTALEQEDAIDVLFGCYEAAGVTPSTPEWNGEVYEWTVSLNTTDEVVADSRGVEMFDCEAKHWDRIVDFITLENAPTGEELADFDLQMVDCINAKGLDGELWLEGDESVVATAEASDCFRELEAATRGG